MNEDSIKAYLRILRLEIGAQRVPRIVAQFQRIEEIARPVLDYRLAPEEEQAPVWRP